MADDDHHRHSHSQPNIAPHPSDARPSSSSPSATPSPFFARTRSFGATNSFIKSLAGLKARNSTAGVAGEPAANANGNGHGHGPTKSSGGGGGLAGTIKSGKGWWGPVYSPPLEGGPSRAPPAAPQPESAASPSLFHQRLTGTGWFGPMVAPATPKSPSQRPRPNGSTPGGRDDADEAERERDRLEAQRIQSLRDGSGAKSRSARRPGLMKRLSSGVSMKNLSGTLNAFKGPLIPPTSSSKPGPGEASPAIGEHGELAPQDHGSPASPEIDPFGRPSFPSTGLTAPNHRVPVPSSPPQTQGHLPPGAAPPVVMGHHHHHDGGETGLADVEERPWAEEAAGRPSQSSVPRVAVSPVPGDSRGSETFEDARSGPNTQRPSQDAEPGTTGEPEHAPQVEEAQNHLSQLEPTASKHSGGTGGRTSGDGKRSFFSGRLSKESKRSAPPAEGHERAETGAAEVAPGSEERQPEKWRREDDDRLAEETW